MSLSVAIRHAFSGFSLDIAFEAPAGVTALFGRSGSGKTTVVNALAGLIAVDAGHARVDGDTLFDTGERVFLPPHRRRIGYVFQEARLFPHMSVRQNLGYGRWFARRHGADVADMDSVVEMLGIGALLARRPGTLSGGERQRVAIGRALLSGPRLLLMDEPLASLDEARKTEILPYLERLSRETKVPILYVSHSVAEVARLATTVVAIDEGRVVRAGTPSEVLSDPQAVPTLGIRDAGAVIGASVTAHHADGLSELAISGGRLLLPRIAAGQGARVRVRIHAHDIMLSLTPQEGISALNQLPVEIVSLRRGDGPGVVVQLRCGTDRLLARITRRSADALGLAPGLACHAILKSVAVAQEDVWVEGKDGR